MNYLDIYCCNILLFASLLELTMDGLIRTLVVILDI